MAVRRTMTFSEESVRPKILFKFDVLSRIINKRLKIFDLYFVTIVPFFHYKQNSTSSQAQILERNERVS